MKPTTTLLACLLSAGLVAPALAQTIVPPPEGTARLPVKEEREEAKGTPGEPARPAATSYGMDTSGAFRHPAETPGIGGTHPFKGSLDYLDQNSYLHNTKVEARYPDMLGSPYHSWQTTVDMEGRRYMVLHEKSL